MSQFFLRENAYVVVVLEGLTELTEVFLHTLPVGLVPKTVLQIELVEVANHIFGLILAIVHLFNAIEHHNQYNFVGHDACLLIEVFVALLYALDRCLQHGLRLAVDAYADG